MAANCRLDVKSPFHEQLQQYQANLRSHRSLMWIVPEISVSVSVVVPQVKI